MTAGAAPGRPDAARVLAVARVLTALDEALDRNDEEVIGELEKTARSYLRSVTVVHDWVDRRGNRVISVGRDVLRRDLHEQFDWLAEMMDGYVRKNVSADDMAKYFVSLARTDFEPLQRRLAELRIEVGNADGQLLPGVVERVGVALSEALAKAAERSHVLIGEKLVVKAMAALGYPNARHIFSGKAKRAARKAGKKN
jgi:hypothetical protein